MAESVPQSLPVSTPNLMNGIKLAKESRSKAESLLV